MLVAEEEELEALSVVEAACSSDSNWVDTLVHMLVNTEDHRSLEEVAEPFVVRCNNLVDTEEHIAGDMLDHTVELQEA